VKIIVHLCFLCNNNGEYLRNVIGFHNKLSRKKENELREALILFYLKYQNTVDYLKYKNTVDYLV